MSALVGMTNREITALADAVHSLHAIMRLTGTQAHMETVGLLEGILRRASLRWYQSDDDRREIRQGTELLRLLQEILPDESESNESKQAG